MVGLLGRLRSHLDEDFRHLRRLHPGHDLDQDLDVETFEDARGVLRLHALIHGDNAIEGLRLGPIARVYASLAG